MYKKVLKKAELIYYKNLFDVKTNSIKNLWANLNRVCSFKQQRSSTVIDKLVKDDGTELTSDADISNFFNDFFCSVGVNLVNKVPNGSKCFTDYLDMPTKNSIYIEPLSQSIYP